MSGLVTGLQNRLHPFESGRHLTKKDSTFVESFFSTYLFLSPYPHTHGEDEYEYVVAKDDREKNIYIALQIARTCELLGYESLITNEAVASTIVENIEDRAK